MVREGQGRWISVRLVSGLPIFKRIHILERKRAVAAGWKEQGSLSSPDMVMNCNRIDRYLSEARLERLADDSRPVGLFDSIWDICVYCDIQYNSRNLLQFLKLFPERYRRRCRQMVQYGHRRLEPSSAYFSYKENIHEEEHSLTFFVPRNRTHYADGLPGTAELHTGFCRFDLGTGHGLDRCQDDHA